MRILTKNLVTFKRWDGVWGYKNCNIMGAWAVIRFKRGLGQLADLVGGLVKKNEVCFWGQWHPNVHYRYKKQRPKY